MFASTIPGQQCFMIPQNKGSLKIVLIMDLTLNATFPQTTALWPTNSQIWLTQGEMQFFDLRHHLPKNNVQLYCCFLVSRVCHRNPWPHPQATWWESITPLKNSYLKEPQPLNKVSVQYRRNWWLQANSITEATTAISRQHTGTHRQHISLWALPSESSC